MRHHDRRVRVFVRVARSIGKVDDERLRESPTLERKAFGWEVGQRKQIYGERR